MDKFTFLGVAALFVASTAVATTTPNCCPAANVLNAHLAPAGGRRLGEEESCLTLRSDNIAAWPVNADLTWVTQGSSAYLETDFTRYAFDLSDMTLSNAYWKDVEGSLVPAAARVVVLTTVDPPEEIFEANWETAAALNVTEICTDQSLVGGDMAQGLADASAYFVILTSAKDSTGWDAWLSGDWVLAQGVDNVLCGAGCKVAVGMSNGETEFLNDVLAALATIGEFQGCQICLPTTPTKAPSAASHLGAGVCVPAATLGLAALAAL